MRILKALLLIILLSSCASFEIKKDSINLNLEQEIKVLQISDLHMNKDKRIYKNLVNTINKVSPDILFITGDSLDKRDKFTLLNEFLEGIDSNISKYAILGNWEHWSNLNIEKLNDIYKKNNVKLLVNKTQIIKIKNQIINIYGTDDLTAGKPNLKNFKFNDESINIILTHSPGYFDYIVKNYNEEKLLVFSGHTHGGQITFFGKPLFIPPGSGEYLKGIYTKENSKLYVSKGIGNSKVNFRLFAKPDIFEITIK